MQSLTMPLKGKTLDTGYHGNQLTRLWTKPWHSLVPFHNTFVDEFGSQCVK